MKRYESTTRRHVGTRLLSGLALSAFLMGQVGCMHEQTRLQSAEETEKDRYDIKTVGDFSTIGNAQPIPLAGVGLVVGLDGTGGESPPDGYRTMLEDHLRKLGVKNVKQVLASSSNALVIVTAHIPPGANKGDPIDVEVGLPPHSKATSLRGGYLKECTLFNYEFTNNLDPNYTGPSTGLLGEKVAKAEGTLLVGFGDGDEDARSRRGRIWAGAKCLVDLPFTLVLNPDQQSARVASLVADRINESFHGASKGLPGSSLATAKNKVSIALKVPAQYQLNLPRFLRVVRLTPLQDKADAIPEGGKRSYRQRLAEDLLDPGRTVTAALRLEALGQGSIQALKVGLESKHPIVRFCSAEALAYLGSPSSGEELAAIVQQQPRLRAFALTAMASLDEAVCQVKLAELLANSEDDETRYGSFRALRTLNDKNSSVEGDLLNESFWLHRVAKESKGLIHMTSSKRAEIVLFGEEPRMTPPFSFLAGEFAITAGQDDERCTISRFPIHGGAVSRKQCSLRVEDVLRTMAEMGALYPEVVELLQQADSCQCLSCRVRCDALPQATSVYDLVQEGRGQAAANLVPAGQDLGSTPTLYQTDYQTSPSLIREAPGQSRDKKAGKEKASAKKSDADE